MCVCLTVRLSIYRLNTNNAKPIDCAGHRLIIWPIRRNVDRVSSRQLRQILQICKLYDCDVTRSRDDRPLQHFIITSYRSLHFSAVLTGKTRYLGNTTINWKPKKRRKRKQCCMRKKLIFFTIYVLSCFSSFICVYGIFIAKRSTVGWKF